MSGTTYVRMSTGCAFDAKVMAAGNAAFGAVVRMSGWCGEHLTDGIIPAHVARAMASDEELEAALRAGLIAVVDDATYQLPAFLKWNRSAAQVEAARESARRRKQVSRRDTTVTPPVTDSVTKAGRSPSDRKEEMSRRDTRVTHAVRHGGVTLPDTDTDTDPLKGVARAREALDPLTLEIQTHSSLASLDAVKAAETIRGLQMANGRPDTWFVDAIRRTADKALGAELAGAPWQRGAIGSYLLRACRNPSEPEASKPPGGTSRSFRRPDEPITYTPPRRPDPGPWRMTRAEQLRNAREAGIIPETDEESGEDPKARPDPAVAPALALVPGGVD